MLTLISTLVVLSVWCLGIAAMAYLIKDVEPPWHTLSRGRKTFLVVATLGSWVSLGVLFLSSLTFLEPDDDMV